MDHHQLDLNTRQVCKVRGSMLDRFESVSPLLSRRKLKVVSNICGAYLKAQDWVNTKRAADIGLRHMEKAGLTDNDAKGKFLYRKGRAQLRSVYRGWRHPVAPCGSLQVLQISNVGLQRTPSKP